MDIHEIALEKQIQRDQARIELCLYMRNVLGCAKFGGGLTGAQIKTLIANDASKLDALLKTAGIQ